MAEKFPNLAKETSIHAQEAEGAPPKTNKNRSTPRHIILKLANLRAKEAILRRVREKRFLTYRRKNIRITSDLSAETRQARRG